LARRDRLRASLGRLVLDLEDRAAIVPERPTGRAEAHILEARRRPALIIGRPVDGQDHLPGVEIEFSLVMKESKGLSGLV